MISTTFAQEVENAFYQNENNNEEQHGTLLSQLPVFLSPPLDHVMSFFVVRSHWMYHIGAIQTK